MTKKTSVIDACKNFIVLGCETTLKVYTSNKLLKTLDGFEKISALMIVDDTVFISDSKAGKVFILDLKSFKQKLLVSGVTKPRGLELVHTNLFIALEGIDKIMILNLDSLQVQEIAAKAQTLAFDEDRLWLLDKDNASLAYVLGRDVKVELNASDSKLEQPCDMTLGRYGDGCGVGRLFIADTKTNQIKVYNPENKSMQVLLDVVTPLSLSKQGCKLYIVCENEDKPLCYNLKTMKLEDLELV